MTILVDDKQVISRDAAEFQGLTYFFTGKVCKRGHIDYRFVSSGGCKSCVNRTKGRIATGPNVFNVLHVLSRAPTEEERGQTIKILRDWSESAFIAACKILADRAEATVALNAKLVEEKEARDHGNRGS